MKMYKLQLSIALVEQREPEAEPHEATRPSDPVARDEGFNEKALSLLEKVVSGNFRVGTAGDRVPANTARVSQTFDLPAESFEEALTVIKKITDSCAHVAIPSSEGLNQGFYVAG